MERSFGSPEEQFCRHSHLSHDQLRQTNFDDFGKLELLEKIYGFVQIPHKTQLEFLQQFEVQQSLPSSKFIVLQDAGGAVTSLVWGRLSARTKKGRHSVEIRVCPPTLLGRVRPALPSLPADAPWPSHLQAIAEDPMESSRGLLGYFSSTQMDLIESLFVCMGKSEP